MCVCVCVCVFVGYNCVRTYVCTQQIISKVLLYVNLFVIKSDLMASFSFLVFFSKDTLYGSIRVCTGLVSANR